MNANFFKFLIVLIFLNLTTSVGYSQIAAPFKIRYQSNIKGDMIIIANNIVNRADYNNDANQPFYNHTNSAKINDEFEMEYIDVDQDESTFSSSSADLFLDNPSNKKIVYAGLYWAATYKYNDGGVKNTNNFYPIDPRRDSVSIIKIKFPSKEKYTEIRGTKIFDGLYNRDLKEMAPYAVYADITSEVVELTNPSGVYTVANISSTEGKLKGGISAGWTLVIVYEDNTMTEKNITTYDGFATGYEKPIDINFDGFKTVSNGDVSVKFACSALEGDNNIIGDQVLISSNRSKTFVPLANTYRKANNFFNSCITDENQYFMNRFPDSKNTLGYDACLLTIPNQNNTVIPNNATQSCIRMQSTGDNFFLFFAALNVETTSNQSNIIQSLKVTNSNIKTGGVQKVVTENSTIKFIPANSDFVSDNTKTASVISRINKNTAINSKKNTIEIQTASISNQIPGYYIIANIFKTEQKAVEFISFLKTKKIKAEMFTNTLNNFRYVYLRKTDNQQEAVDLLLSNLEKTYDDRIQILAINKDANTLLAEANPKSKDEINNSAIAETKDNTEIKSVTIPNQPKGYYLIANVFSINENCTKFIDLLIAKGLNPQILINPVNQFKYVYLKKSDNLMEVMNLYMSKMNDTYQDKVWILSVNNETEALITVTD